MFGSWLAEALGGAFATKLPYNRGRFTGDGWKSERTVPSAPVGGQRGLRSPAAARRTLCKACTSSSATISNFACSTSGRLNQCAFWPWPQQFEDSLPPPDFQIGNLTPVRRLQSGIIFRRRLALHQIESGRTGLVRRIWPRRVVVRSAAAEPQNDKELIARGRYDPRRAIPRGVR